MRVEQRPVVGEAAVFQGGIHALEHVLRHHIGEEPEPAPVDAQHRNAAGGHQARRVEQRAVATDHDGKLRAGHQFGVIDRGSEVGELLARGRLLDEGGKTAGAQMRQQRRRGFAHGVLVEPPQQGAGVDRAAHCPLSLLGPGRPAGGVCAPYVTNAMNCPTSLTAYGKRG